MADQGVGSGPALSIGMAVYNGQRFVARALDSLLAQSFRNYELIISDDASTDRSNEICQSYAARDARIIFGYTMDAIRHHLIRRTEPDKSDVEQLVSFTYRALGISAPG